MKNYLLTLTPLFVGATLSAATAVFTENDTAYNFTDESAWIQAPAAIDKLVITGTGTTGSSMNLIDDETSVWSENHGTLYHNISLQDATFNITNSNYAFGYGSSPMREDAATALLKGASELNIVSSKLYFNNFAFLQAQDSSVITFKDNVDIGGSYLSFDFDGSSKLVFDNSSFNKNVWGGAFFKGSSALELKNGASFTVNGNWGGNDTFYLLGESSISVSDGAKFNTGSDKLALGQDVSISVTGTGSSATFNHGFATDESVEGDANYSMVVSDGGSITFNGGADANKFTGTSTLTVSGTGSSVSGAFALADSASAIYTDGAVADLSKGISLYDNSSVTVQKGSAEAAPAVNIGGTFYGDNGTTLVLDNVSATRSSNTVISGDLLLSVKDSTFDIGSGNPAGFSQTQYFILRDSAQVVLDNSVLKQGSYGAMKLMDDSVFKMQNGSTVAYGNYRSFDVSGNAQVVIDGANTKYDGNFWQTSTFTDDSKLVVSNGATFAVTGRHAGDGIIFSGYASAEVTGGATLSTNQGAYPFIFNEDSSLIVSGAGSSVVGNVVLNDSASATISDGASISLSTTNNVTINDDATLIISGDMNYTHSMIAPRGTSATVEIRDSNFTKTATPLTFTGVYAEDGATIKFVNSTYNAASNEGMRLENNVNVVFDNSTYLTNTFPILTVNSSSTLTFQNGAKSDGLSGGFFLSKFTDSTLNVKDEGTLLTGVHYNGNGSTFVSSTVNITEGAVVNFGTSFGKDAIITAFTDSTLNIESGASFLQNRANSGDGISLTYSDMYVSGASTVKLSTTTVDEDSSVNVIGSNNTVQLGDISFQGMLNFEADEQGISGISTNSIVDFTGALYIDMSNYAGGPTQVSLITTNGEFDWSNYVASADNSYISVLLADENIDSWHTFVQDGNLILTYVPEPSTYAMIFGALAIAFGLMRRRSRKIC